MRGTHSILTGDVRQTLAQIAPGSVQTCITSPPYWNLRDYHVDGQIGSEETPEAYIETLVDIFRDVRYALRDDGTLWLNLGDSYSQGKTGRDDKGRNTDGYVRTNAGVTARRDKPPLGSLPGSQLLMPHRVALAFQADGWFLRSTVIWHKRSPMPESISGWRWVRCRVKVGKSEQDSASEKYIACPGCSKCLPNDGWILRKGKWRPTTGHEYVFLFSKSQRYFADGDSVSEVAKYPGAPIKTSSSWNTDSGNGSHGSFHVNGRETNGATAIQGSTKNPRTVWTLSHEPYKQAHFATYPTELVRRMLLATSPEQCCSSCGSGYAPMIQTERIPTRPAINPKGNWKANRTGDQSQRIDTSVNRDPERHIQQKNALGHRPTCLCNAPVGRSTVLDPFGGSGTTAQVAVHYGRDAILCELNQDYVAMAEERIATVPSCANPKRPKAAKKVVSDPFQGRLFK